MEKVETEATFEDHMDRCRLCLNLIRESDVFYKVSGTTKSKFESLTSVKLTTDHNFSTLLCVACNRDLNKFSLFREDLIKKQSKLLEIVYSSRKFVENSDNIIFGNQNQINYPTNHIKNILEEEIFECDQFENNSSFEEENIEPIKTILEESYINEKIEDSE